MLEVGHDGGVHPRQPVRSVDPHDELGSLSVARDSNWHQEVPEKELENKRKIKLYNKINFPVPSSTHLIKLFSKDKLTPRYHLRLFHSLEVF